MGCGSSSAAPPELEPLQYKKPVQDRPPPAAAAAATPTWQSAIRDTAPPYVGSAHTAFVDEDGVVGPALIDVPTQVMPWTAAPNCKLFVCGIINQPPVLVAAVAQLGPNVPMQASQSFPAGHSGGGDGCRGRGPPAQEKGGTGLCPTPGSRRASSMRVRPAPAQ
jgi:hypothetical protein